MRSTSSHTTTSYREEQRDRLADKIERAQRRAFTRKCRAADAEPDEAKRAALRAQFDTPRKAWFSARFALSVTEQAPLVEECLNDVRARAKRFKRYGCAGCARCAQQIQFLPRGIL